MQQREQSYLDGILNYEKETRLITVKGEDLSFPDYTHMKIFNEVFIISPSAYLSLNNQMQISGNGFSELSDFIKGNLYNEIIKSPRLNQKEFLIILVQDAVKAVMTHSEDKRSYSYIKTSDVLGHIKGGFSDMGIDLEFMDGVFDDYYAVATYRLSKTYYIGYEFLISVIKSNTGYSSLKVLPVIERGRMAAHLKDDELSFEHKGDMLEKLDSIPLLIDKTFKRISKRLDNVNDEKITDVIGYCRRRGLNIRTAKYIQKHFKGDTLADLVQFLEDIDFKGPHGEPKEVIVGNLMTDK